MEERLNRSIERLKRRKAAHKEMHWFARLLWATGGFVVLGAGVAMLVLPGPGLLVIALGLALLALEFAWAERLLEKSLRSGARAGGMFFSLKPWLMWSLVALFLLLAAGVAIVALKTL